MPLTFKSRRTLTYKIGRDLTEEYVSGVCLHSWALDETWKALFGKACGTLWIVPFE